VYEYDGSCREIVDADASGYACEGTTETCWTKIEGNSPTQAPTTAGLPTISYLPTGSQYVYGWQKYIYAKRSQAQAACEADSLTLCSKAQITGSGETFCAYGWLSDYPGSYYTNGDDVGGCGSAGWHSSASAVGAYCCTYPTPSPTPGPVPMYKARQCPKPASKDGDSAASRKLLFSHLADQHSYPSTARKLLSNASMIPSFNRSVNTARSGPSVFISSNKAEIAIDGTIDILGLEEVSIDLKINPDVVYFSMLATYYELIEMQLSMNVEGGLTDPTDISYAGAFTPTSINNMLPEIISECKSAAGSIARKLMSSGIRPRRLRRRLLSVHEGADVVPLEDEEVTAEAQPPARKLQGFVGHFPSSISHAVTEAADATGNAATSAADDTGNVATSAAGNAANLATKAADETAAASTEAADATATEANNVGNGITEATDEVANTAKNAANDVANVAENVANVVLPAIDSELEAIASGIEAVGNVIADVASVVADQISDYADGVATAVATSEAAVAKTTTQAVNKAKTLAKAAEADVVKAALYMEKLGEEALKEILHAIETISFQGIKVSGNVNLRGISGDKMSWEVLMTMHGKQHNMKLTLPIPFGSKGAVLKAFVDQIEHVLISIL